jgi:hypothetical protein
MFPNNFLQEARIASSAAQKTLTPGVDLTMSKFKALRSADCAKRNLISDSCKKGRKRDDAKGEQSDGQKMIERDRKRNRAKEKRLMA